MIKPTKYRDEGNNKLMQQLIERTGSSEAKTAMNHNGLHNMDVQELKGKSATTNYDTNKTNQKLGCGCNSRDNNEQVKERNDKDAEANQVNNTMDMICLSKSIRRGKTLQDIEEKESIFADTSA